MVRIAKDGPEIDMAELHRAWMSPAVTLGVAGLHGDKEMAKWFRNLADREFIAFGRAGAGKTAARLFSLAAALQFRVMRELAVMGLTLPKAASLWHQCAKQLVEDRAKPKVTRAMLERDERVLVFWRESGDHYLALPMARDDFAEQIQRHFNDLQRAPYLAYGALEIDHLIRRAFEAYTEIWVAP